MTGYDLTSRRSRAAFAVLALLAVVHTSSVFAASEYVTEGGSLRADALGGAAAAAIDDPASLHANPAVLAYDPPRGLASSHGRRGLDRSYDHLVLHDAMNAGGLAFSFDTAGSDGLERRDAAGALLGTFGERESAASVTSAFRFGTGSAIGATARYLTARLDDALARGTSFDVGYAWANDEWSLGLSAANLGERLRWENTATNPTEGGRPVYRAGARARYGRGVILADHVVSQGDRETRAGVEYRIDDPVVLRAGLRGGGVTPWNPTFGIGIGAGRIRFDYAFVKEELADSHRIGLVFHEAAPRRNDGGGLAKRAESHMNRSVSNARKSILSTWWRERKAHPGSVRSSDLPTKAPSVARSGSVSEMETPAPRVEPHTRSPIKTSHRVDTLSEGKRLLDEGRPAQAAERLRNIPSNHPDHAESRYWLGLAFMKAGDRPAARRTWREAVALLPAHPMARYAEVLAGSAADR